MPRREMAVHEVMQRLERASSAQVEISSFRSTYFPPRSLAEKAVFRQTGPPNAEPLLIIDRLQIRTRYPGLPTKTKRLQGIAVSGVPGIHVPAGEVEIKSQGSMEDSLIIISKSFVPKTGVLELAANERGKKPVRLPIQHAVFHHVAGGQTIPFSVWLHVPLPPGEIQARGWIGPWRDEQGNVRSTPIAGISRFTTRKPGSV
jgi:hypothetical protein